MNAANLSWAWYSGGWDDANGNTNGSGWTNGNTPGVCGNPDTIVDAVWPNCANGFFQFHHQPFNYHQKYAPGTAARNAHLRDEVEFMNAAKTGNLKRVSFVKPIGSQNEHPGYASAHAGSSHLVDLIKAVMSGPQASQMMIVVTYDENGGAWDHVSPPKTDKWGPGTRVPTLVISPQLPTPFSVSHTMYDTTSVLATIERKFGLTPLASRDTAAADLWRLFS